MKKAAVISLVALSVGVFAQPPAAGTQKDFNAAFDATILRTLEKVQDIPGIAVVVVKDEKPIFTRAYGMADKEAGRKADTDTLWYMGSSTKSFTALVAAMIDKES
jgi:CubicO group peptidase (beta-lactamase class C family)